MSSAGEKGDELSEAVTTPPEPSGRTPQSAPADAALRDLVQRYDILGEIGRGGMGVVYRARDRETGDVVALKVLRPEIAGRPELIERFKSELLLARKVTHKNVCRTHELLRFGDTVVISMEYVEGDSLRAILQRFGGVPLRRGLEWTRQICSALAEAHGQGVVHRDLKPENILVTRDGTLKVMDFGIARSLETAATQTVGVTGTPAYMSPEQAAGKTVDHRTDIYSLGLILYEMFTGQPAFRADTPVSLAMKHIHEKPQAPREVEPYMPVFLERAIQKCLEKDPKKRFQSVSEIESTLSEERPAEAVLEEEPKPAAHHSVWRTSDNVLLALAAAALLCFLGLGRTVFTASKFRLELDGLAARREAEAVAKRVGRTFPSRWEAEVEYREEEYIKGVLAAFMHESRQRKPAAIYAAVEPPMFWKVRFRSPQDEIAYSAEAAPERFVRSDRKGKVIEFLHPVSRGSLARNYRAPPVEQRREIAKKALSEVCGMAAPTSAPVETFGGEGGASYTAKWAEAEVSLFAESVTSVNCDLQPETVHPDLAQWVLTVATGKRALRGLGLLAAFAAMLMMLVAFIRGQCHASPILWRRLPLAAVAGLPSVWLLFPGSFGVAPSSAAFLLGGVGATGMVLVGLVAAEHHLTRRLPAEVASYRHALRGRLLEPAVGLSVLRGALCGLLLTGAQAALARVSLNVPPDLHSRFQFWLGSYVDPSTAAYALASAWPAAYVVFSAVFHGLFVGFILMGLYWSDAKQYLRGIEQMSRAKRRLRLLLMLLLIGANLSLVAVGLRLHFGTSMGYALAVLVVPAFWGAFVAWVFWRYGALAAVVATATNVLWMLNYPLLHILREVGNATQWAAFAGWGIFVLGFTLLAFRGRLRKAVAPIEDSSD